MLTVIYGVPTARAGLMACWKRRSVLPQTFPSLFGVAVLPTHHWYWSITLILLFWFSVASSNQSEKADYRTEEERDECPSSSASVSLTGYIANQSSKGEPEKENDEIHS